MKLAVNQTYKRKEIKHLLKTCPLCSSHPSTMWEDAAIKGKDKNKGTTGFVCDLCDFSIAFTFQVTPNGEIINEYKVNYINMDCYEYRMSDDILNLYYNNTYVRQIPSNIVDLDECKKLLLLR